MKRRLSVRIHLIAAFAACLLALGMLMAVTTASSFQRERARAADQLETAAQENVQWADQTEPQALAVLESVSTQPGITAFDPSQCSDVLSGLASVKDQGHLHLFRSDGSLVCSLQADDLPVREIAKGSWFQEVMATHEPVNGGTSIDVLSGQPSIVVALPVAGLSGDVGVFAAVLYTGNAPLEPPTGASPEMVLIELDADRTVVLAASEAAPVATGPLGQSWLRQPLGGGTRTVADSDGVTRLYREITAPETGWHILAGLPRSVALETAQRELHRNLWLAGAVLFVVAGLGYILHRRLARPIGRLRVAIEAASNDDSARAPVEGPAEIAEVAEAFNETIARRRELEVQLAHQALHDPLTGLPNRTLLADRLNQALARQRRGDGSVVVAFMDLDRFKLINDSKGHPVGDALLVTLARRLEGTMRSADTVARFGGDEFVMVSEGARDDRDVAAIANRLKAVLDEPFMLTNESLRITGSIGLAVSRNEETADELIRNADAAMYAAKEKERGGFAIYQEPLHAGVVSRLQMERDLHRALDEGEFLLHYQPKCSLATGQPVGVEALVRWAHPTKGLVSPADFIPVCEETGLIVPLGQWVLFEAGRQAKLWRDRHGLSVGVSVNLSARQLIRPDLTRLVAGMLESTGADPADLCLEITEGTLLQDMNAAVRHLAELRSLGVRISIDDFGTGYSSLAYLRTLPIDELKIDRSFVNSVADDASAAAIVESVVRLGHALGLVVVAEGVETAGQLATLRDLGCDLAQGYYLARPAPAPTVLQILRDPGRSNPRLTGPVA
ncbi:MAG TPA: EAL domain-containing protein [Acidimicrobiia bacterium]|nr:EAL domain-containing protein [Acidimicrobiia bacterium]